jgi:peptidoglycan/LPS O-acetylase OafA/YrhL
MGLSFFLGLFQVANESSLGGGLWFITIIVFMYLLLPLMTHLYKHKNAKMHLYLIILLCLFFERVMYGTASGWNVAIAFNIGVYISLNSNIDNFSQKPIIYYLLTTSIILIFCALATSKIIPYEIRNFLLPFYPFFAAPLLFKIGNRSVGQFQSIIVWFSSISFEVYILHSYFINNNFSDLFPSIKSVWLQILISMIIVLPLAFVLSKIAVRIGNLVNRYLIEQNSI